MAQGIGRGQAADPGADDGDLHAAPCRVARRTRIELSLHPLDGVPAEVRERATEERLDEPQQRPRAGCRPCSPRACRQRCARTGSRRPPTHPTRTRPGRPASTVRTRRPGTPSGRRAGRSERRGGSATRRGPARDRVDRRSRRRDPIPGRSRSQRRTRTSASIGRVVWMLSRSVVIGVPPGQVRHGRVLGRAGRTASTTCRHRRRRSAAVSLRHRDAIERSPPAVEPERSGRPGDVAGRRQPDERVGPLGRRPEERSHHPGEAGEGVGQPGRARPARMHRIEADPSAAGASSPLPDRARPGRALPGRRCGCRRSRPSPTRGRRGRGPGRTARRRSPR